MKEQTHISLVTGFPTSFLATRVLQRILSERPDGHVYCIVQSKFLGRAQKKVDDFHSKDRNRVTLIEGDTADVHLGLSRAVYKRIAGEVQWIHHCAAVTYPGVAHDVAERANVGGAREIVEFAESVHSLERLVHWSSAFVAGKLRGRVYEEELSAPKGFHNIIEETRYRAEGIVREAGHRIPVTVLRPSLIVGDSITGEIDRLDGPYLLILLMLNSPMDLRLPRPGRGTSPLNLVPVDYVMNTASRILEDTRSKGRTFHIVDPVPPNSRRVFELIAQGVGRPVPKGFIPMRLATSVMRLPFIKSFSEVPLSIFDQLTSQVVYDDRNTQELLNGSGIQCPPFESYVHTMIEYVLTEQAARIDAKADRDSLPYFHQ